MLESRNSYGYGYVGNAEKGFEWLLIYGEHFHQRIKSGYVYKTEQQALKEGNKFVKETVKKEMAERLLRRNKVEFKCCTINTIAFWILRKQAAG